MPMVKVLVRQISVCSTNASNSQDQLRGIVRCMTHTLLDQPFSLATKRCIARMRDGWTDIRSSLHCAHHDRDELSKLCTPYKPYVC
jgi:hypothetical protein